jgi:hypothetical protein
MLDLGVGEELSVALVNVSLLALWAVLPVLLLGCIRQSMLARHILPEFSLRQSETLELDRAATIYQKSCQRITEIDDQKHGLNGLWRVFCGRVADIHLSRAHLSRADELEDLKAHVNHLRVTIIRLRRLPFQRFRSWVHVKSSQFALSGAIAAHVAGFTLLIVTFYLPDRMAWGDELTIGVRDQSVWYPLDEHLFYANAMASGFAALAAPLFYLVQWIRLHREYSLEYCAWKEFAEADPDQVMDQPYAGQTAQEPSQQAVSTENGAESNWFAVLGLSQSATVEEVRKAYRALIKQNHPDRVHNLSPAIRKLADAETRKLNMAYQQAIISVPLESGRSAGPN